MANIYNIDNELLEKLKQTFHSELIITEIGNKRKQYNLADIKIANEVSDSFENDRPLVKVIQINTKDSIISWVPTELLDKRYEGFTAEQINLLLEINSKVDLINKQLEEEKIRKEAERQEQLAKARELRIEQSKAMAIAYELEKKNKKERLEKMQENYILAGNLVKIFGTKRDIERYEKLKPTDEVAVAALLEKLQEKKRIYEEKQAKKENALRLENIDSLDEDEKKVPINQWLHLYKKAKDGEFRDLYESRAIVVNSTLYCNAARALIANSVGSIDKKTGEYTGKEGNKLYAICDSGDDYNGLFARYATPNEISSWVTNIYGEEWTSIVND